jgi:nicotinate-nucleotide adenylyltransferase
VSRRIGVLGSICNPPHRGHASLARCAAEQLGLERVLLIPTGTPAHRDEPDVDAATRLRLAEAAAADEPVLEASAIEVQRPGPSYMVDTLRLLTLDVGAAQLVLLLGADQYAALDSWHDPAGIRQLASIAVAPRAGSTPDVDPGVEEIAMDIVDVSSTEIRRRVSVGASIEGLVSPRVALLITELGLYRA